MNVVFHAAAGPDLVARLAAISSDALHITACPEDDDALLMRLLPETDVLWHVLKPATADMIAAAPRLRLIQKIGVGVNTIDLKAAQARGIPVCNLPGTNAQAVAEMTLLLMLATLRRLPMLHAATASGAGFRIDPVRLDGLGEVSGRVVGLVGYGAIPRALAPALAALGARVIYWARTPHPNNPDAFRSLPDLLAESDILSLHLPLTSETTRIIDAKTLGRMKPGAILVNTARGGLVDQAALTEALKTGRLAGAGLDVFDADPPPPDDPLLALPNVVLTPHVAWLTTGTFDRSFALAAENCRRLSTGESLLNRVV